MQKKKKKPHLNTSKHFSAALQNDNISGTPSVTTMGVPVDQLNGTAFL